ncbi:DUF4114 domain-containing protein [Corallococcus sp. CA054B]|uniref:DUF4114 domain-containing protein n=1 Tax=Corallococcus sp. CA054B TaxID=2316734 RepID=UPI000EA22BD0|nr:DUF4114 domain-containing protein [Corallococcus sp. CA054B]RKG70892.1 DUF4114 domain-containing protein [Corallococcus sp. CA054B]
MRTLFQRTLTALVLAVATPSLTHAQQLCQDDLSNDKQGAFKLGPDGLTVANDTILLRKDGRLQLNTNLKKLDAENIIFPFDQTVTIDYVYESAGASHSLGYMYMEDVVKRGYADKVTHELVDLNDNGILDLHEAIYNLTPDDDPVLPIKYVGKSRRCNNTFTSGGKKYNEPELAMGACGSTFRHEDDVTDARPGRGHSSAFNIEADWVGVNNVNDAQGDRGLFNYIPNLLEPAVPENDNLGIGRMVFLLVDDDSDYTVTRNLGPVADADDTFNGVPDYNVSQYDFRGIKLPAPIKPPDSAPKSEKDQYAADKDNYEKINTGDRRVNLGLVAGGKEIIFFAVVYYEARHNTDNDTVAPCLKRQPYTGNPDEDGKCLLHLQTSVSVFFSKATWNLDQNFKAPTDNVVAERNIGCKYSESCNSPSDASACKIDGTSPVKKACGWLENDTLKRLDSPAYKNLKMPMEGVVVPAPGKDITDPDKAKAMASMNFMPHVIVGAPTTDPFRWILGFEDLNGGGDRDFNDIVFMINKENGGGAKSTTITSDVMSDTGDKLGPDFTITKVRFRRQDDVAPYKTPGNPPTNIRTKSSCNMVEDPSCKPAPACTKAPCWTEEVAGACTASGVKPTITYSIAVDCRVLNAAGVYEKNENPAWVPVPFNNDKQYPDQEVEIDILALGLTGSQLCWKVDISSPSELCRPIIDEVDIGYQAVRSGSYARSSPSTLGNVAVWGVNETPGQNWGKGWSSTEGSLPPAGTRAYDDSKDFTIRGRLYMQSLYEPGVAKTDPKLRWEAGRVMALSLAGSARKLYTMNGSGVRTELSDVAALGNTLLPSSYCNTYSEIDGRYLYDLNNDKTCSVTAQADPATNPYSDRQFLIDWLYGYDNKRTSQFRPWAFGGINLSTVAVAVPPYQDNWYQNAKGTERDTYRKNFMTPLQDRSTKAFVGTMSGVLHAFDAGEFRNALNDDCVADPQFRGYFLPKSCPADPKKAERQYGTGEEEFAYMPNLMLEQYRNQYVRFRGSGTLPKPQMDASPSIANVDLGDRNDWNDNIKYTWTPATTAQKQQGAKTVLVSATGKTSPVVFALDITDPKKTDRYPLPMWEFSLADMDVASAFTKAVKDDSTGTVKLPDNSGSRHAPSVGRISWGSAQDKDRRWVAVVGTDYDPGEARAGAIYILDMKTGKPLEYGSGDPGKYAGVVTFEQGSGIAAETAMLDLDQDGSYDVLYVPTTAGSVWRVNLKDVNTSRKLGSQVQKCMVAHAASALEGRADASQTQLDLQELYSNIAVKLVATDAGPAVRFYFGTSDSPDKYTDGYLPDVQNPLNPTYQYHLLAFEDPDPTNKNGCKELKPLWVQKMSPGQKLWGGVALSSDNIYAATAVGTAADICSLNADAKGEAYMASQSSGALVGGGASELEGHAISAPVVHDEHLFVLTATGKMKVKGGEDWNNKAGTSGVPRSQIMLWEPLPDGRLPQ